MKNYSEFILEVNRHREEKIKGQLKGLEQKYQKDYDDRYMKPFQNKEVKKAQLAPLEKENQLPYKYSKYGIRTVEPSMGNLKDRVKRYGNIERLKDIDSRYP